MQLFVLFALSLCFFMSFSSCATDCFVIGGEEVSPFPPKGFTEVTLDLLQGKLGTAFLSQYSATGLPFLPNLAVDDCVVTLGEGKCVYPNGNSETPLVAYTLDGAQQCIWKSPPGPVKLGTYGTEFYSTLNQSVFSTWQPTTCPYTHYTLLFNNTCTSESLISQKPAKQ